jgi:hypothetical protein
MKPAGFAAVATARFERDYHSLLKGHPELPGHFAAVLAALKHGPYNRTRRHQIKKLEGVAPGDGQYRIRDGRFRFRFDIEGINVFLQLAT